MDELEIYYREDINNLLLRLQGLHKVREMLNDSKHNMEFKLFMLDNVNNEIEIITKTLREVYNELQNRDTTGQEVRAD